MIKFFRKIRKNLLSEGKTGKYMKYAFGEIILVVIGILIALQINNWNQERLNNNDIRNKLKLVHRELIEDIATLEKEINFRYERQNLISRSLKILEEETSLSFQNRKVLDSAFLIYARMGPLYNNMRSYESFLLTESNFIDEEIYIDLNNYIDDFNTTNAKIGFFSSRMNQPQYNILFNSSVKKKRSGAFEYSFNTIQQDYQLYESMRQSMSFFQTITKGYTKILKKAIKIENKIRNN
ncbi:hypothetical protein [Algibacter mikhailovii]|uniref:hypothetical protein n=1 Tax=Algibacter mikhailovii TaxID=425498 RepID=UPI0024944E90|nr:hypothetical protein [Algibacter mikhailovii]